MYKPWLLEFNDEVCLVPVLKLIQYLGAYGLVFYFRNSLSQAGQIAVYPLISVQFHAKTITVVYMHI